ncbi:uncharacterized protein B0H18DRAFT_637676 [Fomitopsis serialis]|uniref:uncharacterized protein n=1 Tax=Fomitopsis serialis TaxID=139415 RepID=UPI00200818B7|nr:uncharacterized protein B0H18DRAFT_637676 [Neoantrodia serialis]KAH9905527.1 hypothetical protein B0H18DRAFT_637676 [Neoantrodia serialis]
MLDDDMHKASPTIPLCRPGHPAGFHRARPPAHARLPSNFSLSPATLRSQHAVRLHQIVADIGPPLTRRSIRARRYQQAIQGLLTREVLFQFDTSTPSPFASPTRIRSSGQPWTPVALRPPFQQ